MDVEENLEKTNILIVDDQEDGLLAAEATLQELQQNIYKARSGKEALRLLLQKDFAVILLDVQMPEMDGYETAEAIRQRARSQHTPLIFLTAGIHDQLNIFKGYSLGAVDYLIRPVGLEILRSKVKVFVNLAQKNLAIKKLNEVLVQQAEDLTRSNRDLEAFAFSISHDLSAPLRRINSYCQILTEDFSPNLPPEARKHLERVVSSARGMSSLIDSFLALSRMTRKEVRRTPVDLSSLALEIAEDLKLKDRGRTIEFLVEKNLTAEADPPLVRSILDNLMGNAWKYTSTLPKAEIKVGSSPDASQGKVYFIQDNGVGFDKEKFTNIFSPFGRYHSMEEFDGHGIGLATVQRLVERHNGKIWVEAQPNRGAVFYFTLG